jgi:hypothetical protein
VIGDLEKMVVDGVKVEDIVYLSEENFFNF